MPRPAAQVSRSFRATHASPLRKPRSHAPRGNGKIGRSAAGEPERPNMRAHGDRGSENQGWGMGKYEGPGNQLYSKSTYLRALPSQVKRALAAAADIALQPSPPAEWRRSAFPITSMNASTFPLKLAPVNWKPFTPSLTGASLSGKVDAF